MPAVKKILSGGQSGADTAALNFAIRHGIAHGGWCPKGRTREGGVISSRFHLRETPNAGFAQRTEWNVRDSDGTAIFTISGRLKGGSGKTARFARKHRKPWLHLAVQHAGIDHAAILRLFIRQHRVRVLNVAGFMMMTLEAAWA